MARIFSSLVKSIGRDFSFTPIFLNQSTPTTTTTTTTPAPPAPTNLIVFDQSTGPNTSVTGGWNYFITGGYGSPVVSESTNGLQMSAPWWQDAVAETRNNIDLTNAVSISIKISSFCSQPWYYYASFNYANNSGGFSGIGIANPGNYSFSDREITIPVTDGGIGKIRLNVTNSEGGAMTLHSVVVNY